MNVEEIESAIAELPEPELAQLTAWFEQFLAESWDKQIGDDLQAGRLDALLQQADDDFGSGRYQPL